MKRFHIHVAVQDIDRSVRFYSKLFGTAPAKHEPDYAKWMLEDPRLNFAISRQAGRTGIDHIGLQVDSAGELKALRDQLEAADAEVLDESGVSCCYARSDKHWVTDPGGVAWESFHTMADIPTFNGAISGPAPAPKPANIPAAARSAAQCCTPGASACCSPTPSARAA